MPENTVVTTTLEPNQRNKVENQLIDLSFIAIGLIRSMPFVSGEFDIQFSPYSTKISQ
ncbi:Uncharacterised protein [Chlamydia trachomatis]|nr:Uncharacterised protein [Chlamydia trachomatis]